VSGSIAYLLDTLQYTVLGGVCGKSRPRTVWVVLAGNLQQGRESLVVFVHEGADLISDMLVDQHNSNVLALPGKASKCVLDISGCRLIVDDKKVLIAFLVHVANARKDKPRRGILLLLQYTYLIRDEGNERAATSLLNARHVMDVRAARPDDPGS